MSDRSRFLSMLPKGSVGVEVGVWMGDLSEEILQVVEPERLHLVDPWEKNDDATNYTSTVTRSQEDLDEVYRGVVKRFSESPVSFHRARSLDVAAEFAAEPIGNVDWVYIDGIHTYDAVTADLAAWWPHIKPGGLMTGHDIGIKGVCRAVEHFAEKHGLPGIVVDNNFMIEKPKGL